MRRLRRHVETAGNCVLIPAGRLCCPMPVCMVRREFRWRIVMIPVQIYVLVSSGLNPDAAPGSITEILKSSNLFFVSSSILGGLCSVLGGYVAARIAKHDELLNGGLSSILCVGSGVYALVSGSAAGHLWLHLAYLPLSVALGTFGGLLRAR
jgi:hypothetical protein